MQKLEILNQIDSIQLRHFLKYVKYPKLNLFPNVNNVNIQSHLLEIITSCFKDSKIFSYSENSEIIALVILSDLDWDSMHFGYNCASINYILFNHSIDAKILHQAFKKIFCEIEKVAIQNNIKFISVSICSNDYFVMDAIQLHNFKFILTWVDGIHSSKNKIQLGKSDHQIGIIYESEIEYFKNIASKYYFKGGRFYLDNNFEVSLVNSMYSKLITSSFKNNDIMLSYRVDNRPIGLFICNKIKQYRHFENLQVAPLRYLVIDPEARQKNIGYELFAETLNYLIPRCDIITTGFEVNNLPSLNLHTKLNFRMNYSHNVFHWWSPKL